MGGLATGTNAEGLPFTLVRPSLQPAYPSCDVPASLYASSLARFISKCGKAVQLAAMKRLTAPPPPPPPAPAAPHGHPHPHAHPAHPHPTGAGHAGPVAAAAAAAGTGTGAGTGAGGPSGGAGLPNGVHGVPAASGTVMAPPRAAPAAPGIPAATAFSQPVLSMAPGPGGGAGGLAVGTNGVAPSAAAPPSMQPGVPLAAAPAPPSAYAPMQPGLAAVAPQAVAQPPAAAAAGAGGGGAMTPGAMQAAAQLQAMYP